VAPVVVAGVEVLILVIDSVLGELMEGDGSGLSIFECSLLLLSYFFKFFFGASYSRLNFIACTPKRVMSDCFVLINYFRAC
jgi:hypothetical protein